MIGIVLNGGYEDDIDLADVIVYTKDGGRDPNTGKQIEDQGFTSGNRGLVVAKALSTPIRVTRGWKCKSDQAPAKGFRYDGLYDVGTYEYVRGSEGYFVWRFTLLKHSPEGRSTDRQNEAPESIGESGKAADDVSQLVALLAAEPTEGMNFEMPNQNESSFIFEPIHLEGTGIGVFRLQIPQGLDHSKDGAALLLRWKQIVDVNDWNTPKFEVRFFQADGIQCTAEISENWGHEGTQVLVFDDVPVVCEVVSSEKWQLNFDRILTCPTILNVESGTSNKLFRFTDYTNSGKIIRVASEKNLVWDGEFHTGGQSQLRADGRFGRVQNPWIDAPLSVRLLELLESYDREFVGERVLPSGTIVVEVRSPGRNWSLNLEDL